MTPLPMLSAELTIPLAWSLLAGSLIGFERGYRGRPAGFRTHALVCVASTLLMLAATHIGDWTLDLPDGVRATSDPTRMAHGILTGLGFLCAGVIFRQGYSVHHLTTAASLWVTAGLGILFGVGMWPLAMVGTVMVLAVLALLRLLDERLPQRSSAEVVVRYNFKQALSEVEFLDLLRAHKLKPAYVAHHLQHQGKVLEHATHVHGYGRFPTQSLAIQLARLPQILEFSITPHDD